VICRDEFSHALQAAPTHQANRLEALKDFELIRAGNLVTVQWRGSPKLSVGVLSTMSEAQAFERAATAMESGGVRPGFDANEMKSCIRETRKRAAQAT
jgi:hypothetical protein